MMVLRRAIGRTIHGQILVAITADIALVIPEFSQIARRS